MCEASPWSFSSGGPLGVSSQRHPGAVLFEFAGQDPPVELVEVDQLDEVGEPGVTVVQAVGKTPVVIHLQGEAPTDDSPTVATRGHSGARSELRDFTLKHCPFVWTQRAEPR